MANKAKVLKKRVKTMEDEILDRLDHVEDCLEDHANAGIRNDNQIEALEAAICPRVAARLTAIEKQLSLLTNEVDESNSLTYAAKTAGLIQAIRAKFGLEFTPAGVESLRETVEQFA
jgi:hypothetical protein